MREKQCRWSSISIRLDALAAMPEPSAFGCAATLDPPSLARAGPFLVI